MNLYAYVGGNPINWTDRLGLSATEALGEAGTVLEPGIGTAVGILIGAGIDAIIASEIYKRSKAKEDDCGCHKIIIYRGVNGNHANINHARAGWAIPLGWTNGGHSNPLDHNIGDTNSIFTSWSFHEDVAEFRADMALPNKRGVVLVKNICEDDPRLQESPNIADPNEGEILIIGPIHADMVIPR